MPTNSLFASSFKIASMRVLILTSKGVNLTKYLIRCSFVKSLAMNSTIALACLTLYSIGYAQVTTPAQWEKIRREREANEANKRQEQKSQEQQHGTNSNGNTQTSGLSKSSAKYNEISITADANGLRKVRSYTAYGLIDKSGKEIVSPVYKDIGVFSGVFYHVSSIKVGTDYDKVWGFIDKNGNKIIPVQFDLILNDFKNGTAQVVLNNEKYFIDESGRIVGEKSVYIRVRSEQEIDAEDRIRIDENYALAIKSEAEGNLKEAYGFYNTARVYSKAPYSKKDIEINLRIAICLINGPSFGWPEYGGRGSDVQDACGAIIKYARLGGTHQLQYYYMGYLLTEQLGFLTDYIEDVRKTFGHADNFRFYKDYEAKESITVLKTTNVYKILGDNYIANNDTSMALKYYMKQEFDSGGNGLIFSIMNLLLKNKNFESAISYVNGINNFPKVKADGYYLLSYAFARNADFKNALNYIDTAFYICSKFQLPIKLFYNETRGYIYYHLAKYAEAMAEFNKVIQADRHWAISHFFRGKIYDMQGKKQEACSDWSIALDGRLNEIDLITEKDVKDAFATCSKKMRKQMEK